LIDLALEGGVLDLGIGLEPVDPLAVLSPEFIGILDAFLIPFLVLGFVDKGMALNRFPAPGRSSPT
jgi:hypothetical protein